MKFWKKENKESLVSLERKVGELSADLGKLAFTLPQELKRIEALANQVNVATQRAAGMNQQILSFLGDVETKFETVKRVLIGNGVIDSEDDFDAVWDEVKGLRVKGTSEIIEAGDSAKIDFEIRDKESGKIISKEKDFPVRLGNSQLIIEEKILGSIVGERMKSFEYTYPKEANEMAGKTVLCNVWVNKVKTKIVKEPKSEPTH